MDKPIYHAFREAGVKEALAMEAADSIPPDVATRADLEKQTVINKTLLLETKSDLEKQIAGTKTDLEKQIVATKSDLEKQIADNRVLILETKTDLEKQIADNRVLILETKTDLEKQIADNRALILETRFDLEKQIAEVNGRVDALGKQMNSNFRNLYWALGIFIPSLLIFQVAIITHMLGFWGLSG